MSFKKDSNAVILNPFIGPFNFSVDNYHAVDDIALSNFFPGDPNFSIKILHDPKHKKC